MLEDGRFYGWFMNSLIIAIITTISNVLFDSLVGYTLCKFRFPGRYIVFIAILSTLMIPTEMLVIPWYLMSQSFGWLDTYWGIMFPGLMTAFGTFLMKQFFETVPDDFIEAARIDGLNELADLVDRRDATGQTGARGPRDLCLPRQLDGLHLAADRDEQLGYVHAACRPLDLRRRGGCRSGSW